MLRATTAIGRQKNTNREMLDPIPFGITNSTTVASAVTYNVVRMWSGGRPNQSRTSAPRTSRANSHSNGSGPGVPKTSATAIRPAPAVPAAQATIGR